jgi:excisionase family DNA binding protein
MTASDLARILRAALTELEAISAEQAEPVTTDELVPLRSTGVSVRTLRAAIRAGDLKAIRVGREYRVRRSDLAASLDGRRVQPTPRTE